jgi:hypothetical protein
LGDKERRALASKLQLTVCQLTILWIRFLIIFNIPRKGRYVRGL